MDFLVGLIETNEGINYSAVIICVLVYIVLFWAAVSLWAARDANRRYASGTTAGAWFILIFLLNFPALMFYLVVRPEDGFDYHGSHGGVNVPLVNFVGKNNELVFGLEMKINGNGLTDAARDMKLTIDWDSEDKDKQISNESLVIEAEDTHKKLDKIISKLRKNIKGQKTSFAKFVSGVKEKRLNKVRKSAEPELNEVNTDIRENASRELQAEVSEVAEVSAEAEIGAKIDEETDVTTDDEPLQPAEISEGATEDSEEA